jgi:hypothetical protein
MNDSDYLKKPKATEYSDYRAVSFIAHKAKIVATILRRKSENNNDRGCTWADQLEFGSVNELWMQLVQFFIFIFFISFIISSSHLFFGLPSGRVNIGCHLYTFFTILSSGIRCKWPNELHL